MKSSKAESSKSGDGKQPKKKQSAGARIKESGKSLVWVALSDEDKQKIRLAAAYEKLPMSQFLIKHGLKAAEKTLKKLTE